MMRPRNLLSDTLGRADLALWLDSDEALDLERLWRSSDAAQIGSLAMAMEILVDEVHTYIEDPLPVMVGLQLRRCAQLLAVHHAISPDGRTATPTAEEGS